MKNDLLFVPSSMHKFDINVKRLLRLSIKMAAPIVLVLESEADVSSKLCDLVIEKANSAIERDGKFTVGLSGNLEI